MKPVSTDEYKSTINLKEILWEDLLTIENPSRYFPSEYYYGNKQYRDGMLRCAMSFPDLYEIGMSNNAMRIIYDLINRFNNAYCDRVFAVAPDFEALLRKKNLPLFTLKENFKLDSLDYLGFTFGCELGITNMLQILDLGKISINKDNRKDSDPVVFAGGPAVTNPLPFSRYADFVCIGEAEGNISEILKILSEFKTRKERIEHLKKIQSLWYQGKKTALRSIDTSFGKDEEDGLLKYYVVPSFQVAQDHGTVEIMRGCPNGCRFCHAGQYYKPFRQRSINTVKKLVQQSVEEFGYREVTLSSLSSGDYPGLDTLISSLNKIYSKKHISFSLPSLKVSSFSLDILAQISEVRKSGLTFAIETPLLEDQRSLNKEVPVDQVIEIIKEAKMRGWKLAKFYFMIGLPFVDYENEEKNIVSFLSDIYKATKINMNINIGTFIPKAHTPFQWARQLTVQESTEHLKNIKHSLTKTIPGIRVSYHEPSISFLEGIISRGDESICNIIDKAYELGCRLDAWDEYLKWDCWQEALNDVSFIDKREFSLEETLPWDNVSMNVSKEYLKREYEKATAKELTSICSRQCKHLCGVCSKKASVIEAENNSEEDNVKTFDKEDTFTDYRQAIFTYSKKDNAMLCSHMAVMRHFEMSFQRSGLDVLFTQGFNPKPHIEFANPLSMGIQGEGELLLCELPANQINEEAVIKLNNVLPEGFKIISIKEIPKDTTGRKVSLASHYIGSVYRIRDVNDENIKQCVENAINNKSQDYSVLDEGNGSYIIHINGEKNLFKLIFSPEMNKFEITGKCDISRIKCEVNL